MRKIVYIFCCIVIGCLGLKAQEQLAPLHGNIRLITTPKTKPSHQAALQKVMNVSDTLPFFEDFSYATVSSYPSPLYWTDSSVFVNTGFAMAPPSIGVATFDGLNKNGYPYQLSAQPTISAPADTLTSTKINLYQTSTHIFNLADSIGFSFLYQSAGFGDNPEVDDSLILEFYKPYDSLSYDTNTSTIIRGTWNQVWGTRGVSNYDPDDSSFKFAFVQVVDTAYLHDGFRFRFKNKATPSGSLDHWNLDYVYMNAGRTRYDTIIQDAAFAYVPRPFLKNYSAMPFKQFVPGEMAPNFSNFIRNNYYDVSNPSQSVKNITPYKYKIFDQSNTLLNTYYGGGCNVDFFRTAGYSSCAAHANPTAVANNFTFSPTSETEYTIVHTIATMPDFCHGNDSIVQKQVFSNYYAYDDGSAEAGYYLNTYAAASAIRITLNVTDTLQAMDIFFDPVTQEGLIEASGFYTMVWKDDGCNHPCTLLMRDTVTNGTNGLKPKYFDFGYNKMPRYAMPFPMILGPGTYYVGVQQISNQQLNIGFDRNVDHSSSLYYNTSGTWHQSTIKGSLMIHPVFGRASYAVGMNDLPKSSTSLLAIYPNPASDQLTVQNLSQEPEASLEIRSVLGASVKEVALHESRSEISLSDLSAGVYFVMLKNKQGLLAQQKLIISR